MISAEDKIEIALQLPNGNELDEAYTWTNGDVMLIIEHVGNFSRMVMPPTLFIKGVPHMLAGVGHISYIHAKYRYTPC